MLKGGGAAAAGLTVLQVTGPSHAFADTTDRRPAKVIPWLDQPAPSPAPKAALRNLLVWEHLDSWYTPSDDFFVVNHYNEPDLTPQTYQLAVGGLVEHEQCLTLADLKDRPRREVDFTLECSGNTGLDFFIGGVGNARWAGTPLAPILRRAGVLKEGREVVFWGADDGEVTVRDNSGVRKGGRTGAVTRDDSGGLDLTITERFARSMTLKEALNPENLLCFEMNGRPLRREHGFPVRLIAPGWYGVANVKWLTHIEVRNSRHQGRFMARDYVTIREEVRNGDTVWTFTSVGRDRLKSVPAKVSRQGDQYSVLVAAWGAPTSRVEVRIDQGPWHRARLVRPTHRGRRDFSWTFWRFPWGTPAPGEHTVTSRALDVHGNRQPAGDDPFLSSKVTFWESNGQVTRHVVIPAS